MMPSGWTRRAIQIQLRIAGSHMQVQGWLSPCERWHLRRMHPSGWACTHVPTGLRAFDREGLLRDACAWCDLLSSLLGEVTEAEADRDTAHAMISRVLEP